jgi:hypothetical protein
LFGRQLRSFFAPALKNIKICCFKSFFAIFSFAIFVGDAVYWNQGCFRTHFSLNPASDLTLMEAASAALTVSFTA